MTNNNTNTNLLELKTAAEVWHEDGASIIPIHIQETADPQTGCYNKDCSFTNWGKWIKQPQTKEEFQNLNWTNKNGFAIILGYQDPNDYYIFAVDFDPKCSLVKPKPDNAQTCQGDILRYEEAVKQYKVKLAQHNVAVEKGKQLLADLPPSRVERTVNGGHHVLFKSHRPVATVKSIHHACKVEVLTEKQLCIMAPSFGYQLIDGNEITIIEDFNQLFQNLCQKYGLQYSDETPHTTNLKNAEKNTQLIQRLQQQQQVELTDEKIQQIVEVFVPVWTSGYRHNLTTAFCGWLIKQDIVKESTLKIVGRLCCAADTSNEDAAIFLKNVHYHYANRANKPDLKGWTGLLQIYQQATGQEMPPKTQEKLSKALPTTNNPQKEKLDKSQASVQLYNLTLNNGVRLFQDQHGIGYAQVPLTTRQEKTGIHQEEHEERAVQGYENIRLVDSKFEDYLMHLCYTSTGNIPYRDAVKQAISVLSYAASRKEKNRLSNRVAWDPSGDGSIWVDTADSQNRAYHITKNGWKLTTQVPILFQRHQHQQPLPTATPNGKIEKLLPFINVGNHRNSKTSQHQQLLLIVQTASYLIPDIPHPINAMYGCRGSHKSSTQKILKRLIDPSSVETQSPPNNPKDALQILDHHYIPIFDNLNTLPRWLSDTFCRAVTGEGQETRQLYTDDKAFIRQLSRCIMLNGVNLPITQSDLLSRTIMHPTEPTSKHIAEAELNKAFAEIQGEILGSLFDVIVKALQLRDSVLVPETDFRLADFFKWGHLIAEALGYGGGEFVVAMEENLKSQHDADQENNVVVDVFLKIIGEDLEVSFATENKPWRIASKCLYDRATDKAVSMGVNTSRKWPKTPQDFVRKLNESKDTIVYKGWNYERYHVENERGIDLWRITQPSDPSDKKPNSQTSTTDRKPDVTDTDDADYKCFDTLRKNEVVYDGKSVIIEHVLPAEPCHGCEQLAVETSITVPGQTRKLRFCKACCDKLVNSIGVPVIYRSRGRGYISGGN